MQTAFNTIQILYVEDNPADARLLAEMFKLGNRKPDLKVLSDGIEAMQYLLDPASAGKKRPDLILLDLNLPRKDGREVLREVKSNPALRRIPIIVFTTSNSEDDVETCYDLQANCFFTKPNSLDQYSRIVALIEECWFKTARLPSMSA